LTDKLASVNLFAMSEPKPPPAWWAVARSEEVTGAKPLSADIGEQPIVLWRDKQGVARALEDRCPHRRAPLSLGRIRDNGWLQCGYHGWTYDGETGRLKEIPNLKDKQKFPPLYKAMAFAVHECDGFVRVCLDSTASPTAAIQSAPMPLSGTVHVALTHEQYIAALFDDPSLLIGIRGVEFTPYLMSELHVENGRLTMERSCQWRGLHWPAPFSPEFPATLLLSTDPVTGETLLTLRDAGLNEHLRAALAPVPAARGVTAVRWRADPCKGRSAFSGLIPHVGDPLTVRSSIDAAALRALKPTASLHGAELRAKLTLNDAAIAA
jgi:nitrite reductase/ring-hydroxylating ferredoxin subunit